MSGRSPDQLAREVLMAAERLCTCDATRGFVCSFHRDGYPALAELEAQAEAGQEALRQIGTEVVEAHGRDEIVFYVANRIGALVEEALAAAVPSPADKLASPEDPGKPTRAA